MAASKEAMHEGGGGGGSHIMPARSRMTIDAETEAALGFHRPGGQITSTNRESPCRVGRVARESVSCIALRIVLWGGLEMGGSFE